MLKFNCLLLTIALSFFTLLFSNTEGHISFEKNIPTHNFQDYHSLNSSATTVDNSFEKLLIIDEQNTQPSVNYFYTVSCLNELLFNIQLNYLKTGGFFNLKLTISKIIYPFHSFL